MGSDLDLVLLTTRPTRYGPCLGTSSPLAPADPLRTQAWGPLTEIRLRRRTGLQHLCMAISNTTYYEALVLGNPISQNPEVGPDGLVRAPMSPGFGYEDVPTSGIFAPDHRRQ
jgi:hypothetical protein